ncbi:MAG TPA: hypothetical protein VM370_00465 [Candidatus Thermoplasmatota archaeon]|nr:hypothetical protein [Candidatus Thermoplasmatota archaeon]
MLRRVLRIGLIVLLAVVMVAGLAWAVGFSGPAPGAGLSRRDAFVGLLTLAMLSLAMFGFDLRDWF